MCIRDSLAAVPNVLGRVGEKETVARNAEAKDKDKAARQNVAKHPAATVGDGKGKGEVLPSRRLRESSRVNGAEEEINKKKVFTT